MPHVIDAAAQGHPLRFLAGHFEVQIAVVLDGVALGVEQGGVPVADGLVAFGCMIRQTYRANKWLSR